MCGPLLRQRAVSHIRVRLFVCAWSLLMIVASSGMSRVRGKSGGRGCDRDSSSSVELNGTHQLMNFEIRGPIAVTAGLRHNEFGPKTRGWLSERLSTPVNNSKFVSTNLVNFFISLGRLHRQSQESFTAADCIARRV